LMPCSPGNKRSGYVPVFPEQGMLMAWRLE
jgi:hypothetical protein